MSEAREVVSAEELAAVVRRVLGEPAAELGSWEAAAIHGGFGTLSGQSGLLRLSGVARVDGHERPWRLVVKLLAPIADRDDPTQIYYWKREALLYRSGVLECLPPGIRAPRCYGADDLPDGRARLWLEHVEETGEERWSIERWALAARHLGRLNGAFLGRPLPDEPWLGGGRLRSWHDRYAFTLPAMEAAADNPAVNHWWPRAAVDAIRRLWDGRETFLTALEALRQTLGHGDAIRRNLLAHRALDGSDETIAIDWEFAGRFALGEEVGQTLSVAAAFFHLEPTELPALDEALFAGYLAGLRDVGWAGHERRIRFAYCAHAALRNLFNAVGATVPDEARRAAVVQNQGRSWEELAERRAAIRPFLLERADEARGLLAAL